jgi:hypothetical protein
MGGHVKLLGEGRDIYRVLVGKPEKRPLGRPRRRWEDMKMDLQEVGWTAWIVLIWLRTGKGRELL